MMMALWLRLRCIAVPRRELDLIENGASTKFRVLYDLIAEAIRWLMESPSANCVLRRLRVTGSGPLTP